MNPMTDLPPQIVADFIASLPLTIRKTVSSLLWRYVVRKDVTPETDCESEIQGLLLNSGRTFRFGALLCVVAALDHNLRTAVTMRSAREAVLTDLAREDGAFQELALQAPLNSRHFDAAWRRWAALRNGPLAPEALAHFEFIMVTGRTP
jgi:hypothetical protein